MTAAAIAGMALVTYLPRLLPFYLVYASRLPAAGKRALRYVPYAALGALIVPDGFTSVAGSLAPSAAGLAVAAALALLVRSVAVILFGAITTAVLVLLLQ